MRLSITAKRVSDYENNKSIISKRQVGSTQTMNNIYIVILLILYFVLTYNVHLQGKVFYTGRIQAGKVNPKIYDIGMKYIPDLSKHIGLEYLAHAIPFILPLIFGKMVLVAFLQLILYVHIVRMVFIHLTILPKHKYCDDTTFSIQNLVLGHCYDKVFSGHFATVALAVMIAYGADIFSHIWIPILMLTLYAILIIALRFHYTVDIAVAVLVAYVVYSNKNTLI